MVCLVVNHVALQAAEERATRENNSLVERNQRLVREVQEQMASNVRLVADNKQKAIELKQKEEAIRAVQAESAKVVKAKEAAQARAKTIEKQKEEAEQLNDQLRQDHDIVPYLTLPSYSNIKSSTALYAHDHFVPVQCRSCKLLHHLSWQGPSCACMQDIMVAWTSHPHTM